MLIDHTHGDRPIDPDFFDNTELIQQLRLKLNPRSYEKLLSIVDKAIEETAKSPKEKLTLPWACAGSLFGHSSAQIHKDVEYLWDKIIEIVGPERYSELPKAKALGFLIQRRSLAKM